MLTPEEFEAVLERIRTGSATEEDLADLSRSLKLEGEIVQIGLQQGQYNVTIGNVEGQDIQFGDRIYQGVDAETIRKILREVLGITELLPPSLEEQQEVVCHFLQSVHERFSSVEFLHRRGEKVALRDQYIPIQVTLDKQPEKSSARRYLGYVESEAELQRAYAFKKEDEKRTQVDWQEAKKKHQRIMVLADPGMGKTTLLRMEAGTIAQQEQQALADGSKTLEAMILPVWLRLSNLAEQVQQATDTVLEAILKLVKAEWDDQQFAKLQPSLDAKLRTGQCLLLLDALDEVPRTLRDRLTEKLNDFARTYSCPIICTSRIVGYTNLLSGATEVEIVPFNPKQRAIYIEKWFTNAADILDETVSAKNLIQELQSKPQIQGLAANSLLLSLICSLYQEKGITLPARRCQVYPKAVEYMLGKWCIDNQRKTQAPAWIDAKTELLEELAYQFTCESKELFDLRELRKKIEQYKKSDAASSDFEDIKPIDLITELAEQDGILQKLTEKDYLFFHRTFQEYFTARYLVRAGERGIQLAKAHLWNYEWHETISLMVGLMDEPLNLFQEILKEKDDIFHTQLLLAGRCLAEYEESINPLTIKIIEKTVHEIHQFWCRYPDAEFVEFVIASIGKANLNQLQR
ncbi:MAG: NACHT domain-containing protein [Phormidesmis sp. CAN_BIN44]|nr:NACHT domain-containing protein [Phormidesmis sp. CAN_BIN44]